jgi:hypothetical protein
VDPTLAAIVTVLSVLAASGVIAHARKTLDRYSDRHRAMALERGLSGPEIRQLEQLSRLVSDTTLADLLISPIRFSRCTARELARLRAANTTDARFYDIVDELTRLRRRIHPPGKMLRFLYSTREMPEGEEMSVSVGGSPGAGVGEETPERRAVVWTVNEDYFELRLLDALTTRGFSPGARVALELNRTGQGRYTMTGQVRKVQDEPRPVVRIEHTDRIKIANRRAHLRESHASTIFVRHESDRAPFEAKLLDLSGGGLSFALGRPLSAGSRVEVTLVLRDSDVPPIRMEATVLRRDEIGNGYWSHTGTWLDLPEETRESLIRYVFGLHRNRIKEAKTA